MPEKISNAGEGKTLSIPFECEGMAEAVGVGALLDVRLSGESGEQVADVVLPQRLSQQGADQRPRVGDAKLAARLDPPGDNGDCARIEPDHAPLVALAVLHHQRPGV